MTDLKKLQNGSDIRGIALGENANLKEEEVRLLTFGFIKFVKEKIGKEKLLISVGRDSRITGEEIKSYIIDELLLNGMDVIDTDLSSTPAMFMANIFKETNSDASIMITASHLPMDRNGMKFFTKAGGFEKEDISKVISYASAYIKNENEKGTIKKVDLISIYSKHLRDKIILETGKEKPLEGLHIVVDAGNGAGGFYATEVLKKLGANISGSQFLEPDGTFPNHVPNPEDKIAMESISSSVKLEKADLGLIFDTDVDRVSAVDEKGNEISRNKIVALAASLIAKEHKGTTVVTDSITSKELTDFLENILKLKHLRYMRGYRNVINKSMELGDSELAIETSGHAAYKENYYLDDGAYLATKIVISLAKGNRISTILKDLKEPKEAKEIRIKVDTDDFTSYGDTVLNDFKEFAIKNAFEIVTPNYEGVRVNIANDTVTGWLLIRKSLHDPILPMNIEVTNGTVSDIFNLIIPFLKNYDKLVY